MILISDTTVYPIYVDSDLGLDRDDMKDWCYRTIGNMNWNCKHTSKPGSYCFIFCDKMDAMAFKLRFGVYEHIL